MQRVQSRHLAPWAGWQRGLAIGLLGATALAATWTSDAHASPREQAYQIYNRINSVPPSEQTLASMAAKIAAGQVEDAARDAINDDSGNFYGVTLVDLVSRWTNTDKVSRVPLNDYTATVIGMIRDDVQFNTVLSADILYVGDPNALPSISKYSLANNKHYVELEKAIEDGKVKLKDALQRQTQSGQSGGLSAEGIAGVQSTRGFGEAYFKAGTNRRAVKFLMSTFLCRELEQLADSSRSDYRVRRDVSRTPGGEPSTYRNKCASCHAGMDGLAGAYAYYDMVPGKTPDTAKLTYSAAKVAKKYDQNTDQFPDGYMTTDDGWANNWLEGQNATIGWHPASNGTMESTRAGMGAKSLGELLTATDAFASCMAERSFAAMCLHKPNGANDQKIVDKITSDFSRDYNLKNAMVTAVVACSAQ